MLIDTIAEAIWNEDAKSGSAQAGGDWGSLPAETRERFLGYARAALQAMSVPTAEMLSQGNRALQAWDDSEHYRSPITGIYRAMISAELPPQPPPPREDRFDDL